jgi:hypothetical protein
MGFLLSINFQHTVNYFRDNKNALTINPKIFLAKLKLKVWWHDAILFVYLIFSSTYIQSITFILYIHPSPFAEVPLHLLIAGQFSRKNLPGVPSRTRACLTASRRATI